MLKTLLSLSVLLLTSSFAYATPDLLPPVNGKKIQKLLDHWRASSGIPGAALSIYTPNHDEPLTYSSGTSLLHGGAPINNKTLFQAGSITKSFTAMVILKLEAEGKLNIDDPITRYLPQYPQWHNVTIRQLLNHTSGISNYTSTALFNKIRKETPQAGFTPEQLVKMAGSRMLFEPGQGWKYSNTNYILAGMIIERVTGSSTHDIMNQFLRTSDKVNLFNTHFFSGLYPSSTIAQMAHGYNSTGKDVTYDNMSWASTAGAIVTTSEDLLSWWYDLLQGKILPQSALHKMLTLVCEGRTTSCRAGTPMQHLRDGQSGYGYGLGIIQMSSGSSAIGPVWWHNGTTAGYRAIVMWFPKSDIYMALTINQGPGYLLKPTLPLVRNVVAVLLTDANPTFVSAVKHKVKKFSHSVKRKKKKKKKKKGSSLP